MKSYRLLFFFLVPIILLSACTDRTERVLIFSKTAAFRHASIEEGVNSLSQYLSTEGITVDTTEDSKYFVEDSLRNYSAVIFLSTTGDVLDNRQQADFERYIQAGGGYVGIHAASDTEYMWPWYNDLVGAYFDGHPDIQDADLIIKNSQDKCCSHLPQKWNLNEEWYNFKSINPDIEVLIEIDESSYSGGTNSPNHPMVWRHAYDGGRSFYTALGHKSETFADPLFLKHVAAGIEYAIGDNSLDYSKARTMRMPEENRFNKRVLDFNLEEPMEMDELPNRGILFVERRGAIKLYEYETEQTKLLDSIDVYHEHEDGLLGVAVDPNFENNNWIYFFYSPDIDEATQHISRFTLVDDKLLDEKIIMKIPLIRKCCHSGGSLEFGHDGLLYIGVGDNTNPFESDGYAPIDEREGRALFDAQRSASNTNDLKGKILRIRPEKDGTYSIPEGNLFEENNEKARPEIFVMGCRNPYRFSIDSKTNYVYWGDVGPDAGKGDTLRGPKGMGEFNQAKRAGYYGWPYSRGNNQMYFDYDFDTRSSAELFDPGKIINNSPRNTGLRELPEIKESMIWYGYDSSQEFPWLGDGGVNPMSGPIYHMDDYEQNENSFPSYFDNKWFIYEWMRDWIYVVELDENHQFVQADKFMPNTEFAHPNDMLFARDGTMYVLEYGRRWFSKNLDARLSEITYNVGNRPPSAEIVSDKDVGAAPLAVQFSAAESLDYDKDQLIYEWSFEDSIMVTESPLIDFVFQDAGEYYVELVVTDEMGNSAIANKTILVGNEPPKVRIELNNGSDSTYWKSKKVDYRVVVEDAEDGSTSNHTLDEDKVKVTMSYLAEGEDLALASIGHQQNVTPKGLELINKSDCKACHAKDDKVAGPSYIDIASKYDHKDKPDLIKRIIKGSQGIWGETMMAAHPQLPLEDVSTMVNYILSLGRKNKPESKKKLIAGSLKFDQHAKDNYDGRYILTASYMDQGHPEIEELNLSSFDQIIFTPPKIEFENAEQSDDGLGVWEHDERKLVGSIVDGKCIVLGDVDFENLKSIIIGVSYIKDYKYAGEVEVRRGDRNGKAIGRLALQYFSEDKGDFRKYKIDLLPQSGRDKLVLVFINRDNQKQFIMNGDFVFLDYK